MPQNTNLNVSPYFDDFDDKKSYQRVLFKPGTPIQARELTTLQSILQNQVEKFGKHFFKEGSMVIPGQIGYDSEYSYVQIDDTHLGIPVSAYIDKFVGKSIKGETSGVTAVVENYITNTESEKNNYTLYVKYKSSSDTNFTNKTFVDGENLISLDNVDYTLSSIRANTSFATSIISGSVGKGSAAKIEEGVYFVRGFFITVPKQVAILDQYTNTPTYRVGLLIDEEIAVATNNYNDLFDNAQGFSNYAAPGADRLKISTTLIKKEIDDFNDQDFVELLRVENGGLTKFVDKTDYNLIRDELARRTYDESGDYYVRPFDIQVKESLNDRIGNNGIYYSSQKTKQGNTPSKDLACISISPGKAYVRGYEIETISNIIVDIEKPRTTERAENASIPFNVGRQILLNNVRSSIGVGLTSQVSLYSDRTSTVGVSSGTKIGVARLYDLKLKNAAYSNASTQFESSLYDIQTYTVLTINTALTQTAPAYIEGKNSGAKGYLVSNASSTTLTLYQVSGSFIANEQIKINGLDVSRSIASVKDYSLSDVHQIVANESVSGVGTFTADPILSKALSVAEPGTQFTITSGGGGISTVTTSNQNFYVGINVGDIVSYTKQGESVPTYNKVSVVSGSSKSLTIVATTSVSGICSGALPSSTISANDFKVVSLDVLNTKNAFLYARLNNSKVSNLDLTGSDVVFKKSYTITAGELSDGAWSQTLETDTSLTFEPFDEEDYNLTFADGTVAILDNQKLVPSGRTISIQNIVTNTGAAILTATLKKINTKTRKKSYNRCSSLTINKTSSGISTNTSGLTVSAVYGLRVEDDEISLNVPDVESVIGVFESSSSSTPTLPAITIIGLNSNILNSIKGERIVGKDSGAVASLVSNDGTNEVKFVYLNENIFSVGEKVTFEESQISGTVDSIQVGDKNIKTNFILDEGQRSEYLDFSRLIRKPQVAAPTKQITIIYNNYTIDSSDAGDFVGVNSYDKDRYGDDISSVDGISLSDVIDLRPRVAPYSGTKSPFEYESRLFTGQNSTQNVFAQNKAINLSYDYYLPRIDRLFLTKEGSFIVNKGIPSLQPKLPNGLDSCLEIATIRLPAYLNNSEDASTSLVQHKRYTMKDISRLEDRLSNVEYYTSLSLLETDTQNLTIRDTTTKLDRFKCGFFVDNFRSYNGGEITNRDYKSSIDTANGLLRPTHYTTSIDLLLGSEAVIGIGQTSNPDTDLRFVSDLGSSNIKRIGDLVCLNYSEVEYTKNQFATRSENVNPFNVINWIGSIQLNPSSDTWNETRRTERTYDIEGDYETTTQQLGVDSNTGLSPIDWNAWETTWTGTNTSNGPSLGRIQTGSTSSTTTSDPGGGRRQVTDTTTTVNTFIQFNNQTVTTSTNQSRQGIQFGVTERFDSTNLGDKIVSREIITTMRSRNIEIIAKRLKPSSRVYAFFDNVDMTSYVIPKLIEVSMSSGTFTAGETVVGSLGSKTIRFRLATQNHKYGPYNSPTETFSINPYLPENSLSSSYSSTTTILNVDTASLEMQVSSGFYGSIAKSMQLVGQTSGAIAIISDMRLVADESGVYIGSLFIPDPTIPSTPSFRTGTKTFVLTSSSTNTTVITSDETTAEVNFTSAGTLDNVENSTLSIRNANVERIPQTDARTLTSSVTNLVSSNTSTTTTSSSSRWVDPLAQSFEVADNNGVYITKCDIFFKTKDTKGIPVTLQIRAMQTGLPTQTILPFSEVTLDPKDVKTSENGTVATTFNFSSPVYLEKTGSGYSIVLVSSSDSYNVWISRMGETDVSTTNKPDSQKIIVSKQPTLGALFKSQNGSTWTASDLEDLKFTLYRADFVTSPASFRFYNPDLSIGNNQVVTLRKNPLNAYSNSALIGLGKSLSASEQTSLGVGNTISQTTNTNFISNLVSKVGAVGIGSTLTLTNVGSGFTSNFTTYSNINLITLTGFGKNAKINLSVSSGVAVAATITDGGTGYAPGDTLTVNSTDTSNLGKNLILTIPNNVGIISAVNSIIVDNIQGKVNTTSGYTIINNGTEISGATVTSTNNITDGLHFKVNHQNHGMYSPINQVTLSRIESDIAPVKLTADYSSTSTSDITLNSIGTLATFENLAVGANNPGYVIIDNEIIKYTGTSGNTLTGISGGRGIDNTVATLHLANTSVFKYEFNGVSLRRINKTHKFTDVDLVKYPIELDSYHIKIDQANSGADRSTGNTNSYAELFFKQSKSGGTYSSTPTVGSFNGPKATQNITFNSITPNIQTLLPETTSIGARIRTTTGTSVNGNEISFADRGFEDISLNSTNQLSETSAIYSKVNELSNLTTLPGNRSFTMELLLSTGDKKVSPMIDLHRVNIITTMNRINNPVSDFVLDPKVNQLSGDLNAAIYVSKIVKLQKSADSLKVLFDAYRHSTNDIRVMYRLLRNDTPDSQQLYEFFPGYDNLDENGNVINSSKNNGRSDRFVQASNTLNDFGNYEFTGKNITPFNGFQIKIIMTGTNQSYVPLIRDLRAIASI
jgi:hypothetical protein